MPEPADAGSRLRKKGTAVNSTARAQLQPVPLRQVMVAGPFWSSRLEVNRVVTIPDVYAKCHDTGRIDALRLTWRTGDPNPPHHYWDSDVAKWLEAAAYSLTTHSDAELERRADAVVDLIVGSQQPDGYLNTHFTLVQPENRWRNLRDMHELYCAGHLIEAAVAYYQATGKTKLLVALRRYADYIGTVFGPAPEQAHGYPGHEEIELALVKLYRTTGERRYLDLACYFVDERGRQPHYFDVEARARGDDPKNAHFGASYEYNQSHLPVREHSDIVGHSVRATYLYTAVADIVTETGDSELAAALHRLWRSMTERRMYLTGGIGSSSFLERFTYDFDLPNDIAYAETCAGIGLIFWAHRMLQIEPDAMYGDVIERALYNGVLSGVSLQGDTYFYANPLEVFPPAYEKRPDLYKKRYVTPFRQGWFDCSCCPPNLARLLASLGAYVAGTHENTLYVHLYTGGRIEADLANGKLAVLQDTRYPWDGEINLLIEQAPSSPSVLAVRIPGWARSYSLAFNGARSEPQVERGYARIERLWHPGDRLTLRLPMPVEEIETHPAVRETGGRLALQRGPLVYCFEEADNGPHLNDLQLVAGTEWTPEYDEAQLGGIVVLRGAAWRRDPTTWNGALYRPRRAGRVTVPVTAIPYYAWANRLPGEMLVWIPACFEDVRA
jgi:uncharacterized protein